MNHSLLNDERVKDEIKKKSKYSWNYENTAQQNLWDTSKTVLRVKFLALRAYIKKSEGAQINDATQALENWGKPKANQVDGKK